MTPGKLLTELVQKHAGNLPLPQWFSSFIDTVSSDYEGYEKKVQSLQKVVNGHAIELAVLNRKLQEEAAALKNTHQELSRIFNQVNEGFFTRDVVESKYIHMSVGCEKIYGYSIAEFFANNMLWSQVIHPDDKSITDDVFESLSKGIPVTSAYRIIHKDTSTRWIEVKALPVTANGKLIRVDGVVNDITARKQAEIRLSNSEVKYRSFFENNMDGILLSKPNGPILEVNPAACEIFRTSAADICALTREELMQYAGPALPAMLEERTTSGHFKGEINFTRQDGSKLTAEIASGFFKDASGEDRSFIIIRDITERKNAEKELSASEHRYRTLFEQNLAGIYQTLVTGEIISCNQAFAAMSGYSSPEQIVDINAAALYYNPAGRAHFINTIRQQKKLHNYETILKRKDSTPLNVLENITLTTNSITGQEIFNGIMIDVTEWKKAEAELKESEQRYRQIVETAQEGILMMNEHNEAVFINNKMGSLLNYFPEEILGQNINFFVQPESKPMLEASLKKVRKGMTTNMDLPLITKDGKIIWTNLSASAMLNHEKQFYGSLAMVTDITKRKLDEDRIRKSEAVLDLKNRELRRKNTELEQFAYVASHDLQEPLRTTTSFVQLLLQQYQGKLDEKADKYFHFILDSVDRMKRLITDLLEYSRIGSKLEMEPVNCDQVLLNVTADLHTAIQESGAEISAGDLPVIYGYPTEIKQLFQNLLINAFKFRKPGAIPKIKICGEKKDSDWLFAFTDNGIGIDEAYKEKIFIIFQRLHTRTEYEGSGIGLSHCKKIVELHHGKIWVESTPGEGSTFYFTIPENAF